MANSVLAVALVVLGISASAHATLISNGGFETGLGLGIPNNAPPWQWTPDTYGERVNALTNSGADDGSGTLGTHLIDPLAGSWFGYVENSADNRSANVNQSVFVDPLDPTLNFSWRFFTNETPGLGNTFNDRFQVDVEGSLSLITTVASVNGTPMISTDGPLYSPTGSPGQDQSFALYTAAWANYSLDLSAFSGETVNVYFRISDVGGNPHSQSSGFALDVPEPGSMALLGIGIFSLAGWYKFRRRAA